ncbi:hypothetical protein [Vibrio cholerae]|uniref:Uncharacterized protein n=1 Tax=Vibrio cholerae TaxID=666 RepID=A0A7Z7YDS9_VIBCL|nr:hypothetical protein [Vibrio cholerae]TBM41330.1 hypothetical protein EYB64_12205 [Vibrio cholerae]
MNESEAYSAIAKFVASAIFLLVYIYLVQHSQDLLVLSIVGLGFIVSLIQGLRSVLIKPRSKENLPEKRIFSKGKELDN